MHTLRKRKNASAARIVGIRRFMFPPTTIADFMNGPLELEPQIGLYNTWIAGAVYGSEPVSLCPDQVAIGVIRKVRNRWIGETPKVDGGVITRELGMVESVEHIESEPQPQLLRHGEALFQREVPVVDARTEEVVRRRLHPNAADLRLGERGTVDSRIRIIVACRGLDAA